MGLIRMTWFHVLPSLRVQWPAWTHVPSGHLQQEGPFFDTECRRTVIAQR